MTASKTEIQKAFKALPTVLQEAIMAPEVNTAFQEITKRHNLHLDVADRVAREGILVLIGLMSRDEYRALLSSLGLAREQVEKLYGEIESSIFKKVQDSLRASTTKKEVVPIEGENAPIAAPKITDPYHEPI